MKCNPLKNLVLIPFLVCALAQTAVAAPASSFQVRVELMKYVTQEEAKVKIDTHFNDTDFQSFLLHLQFMSEAEAYQENDACLVLGYQSVFKNNVCRMSGSPDATQDRSQCSGGTIPCNPEVFGKSEGKIFCVTQGSDQQLSLSCAFSALSSINKVAPIPGFKDMDRKKFDLSKISISDDDATLKAAFAKLFSAKDASLDAAMKFTKNLCASIQSDQPSSLQKLDIQNCNHYLNLLTEAAKVPTAATQANQTPEVKIVATTTASAVPAVVASAQSTAPVVAAPAPVSPASVSSAASTAPVTVECTTCDTNAHAKAPPVNVTCATCNIADQNAGAALNAGQQSTLANLVNAVKQQQQPVVSLSTSTVPAVDPNLSACLQALGASTPAVSINDGIDSFFASRYHDHIVEAAANAGLKDEIGTDGYQAFQKDYPACVGVVTSAQFAARYSLQFKTP